MAEKWLPIPEWEGLYEVSDQGRVLSVRRKLIRKLQPDVHDAYLTVNLSRDGTVKKYFVHRLVLLTFVGPCPEGMESRHLNGKPDDNRLHNLKWDTRIANARDKYEHRTVYQHAIEQCPAGHDYNEANTYVYVNERGRSERHCRMCRRERMYLSTQRNVTRPGVRHGKKLA